MWACVHGCGCAAAGRTRPCTPDDLPPLLEALGADLSILVSGEEVAAEAEVVADSAEGLQDPLRVLR